MTDSLTKLLTKAVQVGDCLQWTGCLNSDGYARCLWKGNYNGKAHRIVYQLCHPDEDIKGKVIRHSCDNIVCINPAHLVSGTPADNSMDRDTRERHGLASFTAKQIKTIRKLYASGEYKQSELAALYDVSRTSMWYILHNLTYRWVQ